MSSVLEKRGVAAADVFGRVQAVDWHRVAADLDVRGSATIEKLLDAEECEALSSSFGNDGAFRKRIVMAQHNFGQGEYKYFRYPLPEIVALLRTSMYPYLAAVANRWQALINAGTRFPESHAAFIARCHDAGQARPTPLLLSYTTGDYNCLHQDIYGEHVFPLQAAVLLSDPGRDFTGGEFVLTEQRPRMQSRPEVVPLTKGDAVVFAVSQRPMKGTRGFYRVNMRHGVSRLRSGQRKTLGIIFHDAA